MREADGLVTAIQILQKRDEAENFRELASQRAARVRDLQREVDILEAERITFQWEAEDSDAEVASLEARARAEAAL